MNRSGRASAERVTSWHIRRASNLLRSGGLLAYPTEAVWGLGCLPSREDTILRLLALKQRPAEKGLILIAADWSQLAPWVADSQPPAAAAALWPGHVTCLVDAAATLSPLIRGQHTRVAVRISAHPAVKALCLACDSALISTSANRHGMATPRSKLQLRRQLGHGLDGILHAELGGAASASRIMDPQTGHIIRP